MKRFLPLAAVIGATALSLAAVPALAASTGAAPYQHACAATAARGYATCLSLHDTALAAPLTPSATDAPGQYEPADLQSAYSLTAASASRGSGETVAIVDAYKDPAI